MSGAWETDREDGGENVHHLPELWEHTQRRHGPSVTLVTYLCRQWRLSRLVTLEKRKNLPTVLVTVAAVIARAPLARVVLSLTLAGSPQCDCPAGWSELRPGQLLLAGAHTCIQTICSADT